MNRQEYFSILSDHLNASELEYVQQAYWLVKEAHRRQYRRLNGERFFEHVRRVSFTASYTYGYMDAHHIALGLLHDTVEDTYVPPAILLNLFGSRMYKHVLALSKEIPVFDTIGGKVIKRAKLTNEEYFPALAEADIEPRRIKGCDRIDNLSDFASWEPERQKKYIIETNTFILPIVEKTDIRMAEEIRRRLVV